MPGFSIILVIIGECRVVLGDIIWSILRCWTKWSAHRLVVVVVRRSCWVCLGLLLGGNSRIGNSGLSRKQFDWVLEYLFFTAYAALLSMEVALLPAATIDI